MPYGLNSPNVSSRYNVRIASPYGYNAYPAYYQQRLSFKPLPVPMSQKSVYASPQSFSYTPQKAVGEYPAQRAFPPVIKSTNNLPQSVQRLELTSPEASQVLKKKEKDKKPLSQKRADTLWLALTKLVSGGIISGFLTSKLMGKKVLPYIGIKIALGMVEVAVVDHLHNRKDSIISTLVKEFTRAADVPKPEIPLSDNNYKKNRLNLISALVSATYSFLTISAAFLLPNNKDKAASKATKATDTQTARTGIKKSLNWIKTQFSQLNKSKAVQWALKKPWFIIPAFTLNGFAFGWMEASLAQKASGAKSHQKQA